MSLELAVQENTAAIKSLIAALVSGASVGVHHTAHALTEAKDAEPKKPAAATASSNPGATHQTTAPKASAPAGDALDYEKHVKPAALALASKKGRDALITVLGEFGLTNVKDAQPDQYAAMVAKFNAAVAA